MVSGEDEAGATLAEEADRAFANGDNQRGLALLRRLGEAGTDPALLHRLGVVEEQIGSADRALAAHLQCLKLAPNNPLAYLYAGYCLQQLGRSAEALEVLSLGSDLDPTLLLPAAAQEEPSPTNQRKQAARALLRRHLGDLHRAAVGDGSELARVRNAIWIRTHDRAFHLPSTGQVPQLFYVPGLAPIRFADTEAWEWAALLQERSGDITAEYRAALPKIDRLGRPYLEAGRFGSGDFEALAGSRNWTALDLYKDGIRNDAICEHFPHTLEVLAAAPLYGMGDTPYEMFFSVLRAGQHIKPHYGLSNHSLTVHLPIVTPPNCRLTVHGEHRNWSPGQLIAFDDTFLHEAINGSEQDRVVLIFSIWHPELSVMERHALQRSFSRRAEWLAARKVPAPTADD